MRSAVAAQQFFAAALARGAGGFALAPVGLFAMQIRPRAPASLVVCLDASVLQAASPAGPMRPVSRL